MMKDPKTIVSSREDMMELAERARAEGRVVLSCDSPVEGLVGYTTFLQCPEDWNHSKGEWDEKQEFIFWPFLGRALTPDTTVARTREDIEAFRSANPEWRRADDPPARRLGFVSYRRAGEGKSDVLYVPLTSWDMLPEDMRPGGA